MKLFNPSELQSTSYNDLVAGQCFYDTDYSSWFVVFALAGDGESSERYLVPLSGDNYLVASPFKPQTANYGIKRVVAFNLWNSFTIKLDSEPTISQDVDSWQMPLLIMQDGPAVYTQVIRNRAVPRQREGLLLNWASFQCDFADPHRMEIADAVGIESWALIFKDEPNRGKVFFQHQPPLQPAFA